NEGTGEPSIELLRQVRARLNQDDVRLTTDNLMVRGARLVEYDVIATLVMRPGPDPELVRTNATTAINALADRYKRLGGDVPVSALASALYVGGVDRVVMTTPAADIATL